MRSATAFLPSSMMTLTNLVRSCELNLGSGRMSRLGTSRRRGTSHLSLQSLCGSMQTNRDLLDQPDVGTIDAKSLSCFRPLRAVLRPALLAVLDTLRIQRAAHDVVTDARQVFHAATANQYH